MVYKLRWNIETFFGWWKRHLKVYHLIARSEHGLMVQIIAGLITYLLLAIYCHEQHHEKVMLPAYKAGHPSKVDYNFGSCHSSPLTKRGMLSAPRQHQKS